jgi:hypothetical protein
MTDLKGAGLDIGTNMLVAATVGEDGNPVYKRQRDAFLRISPKTEIHRKSIRASLESRKANFILEDNDFVVVGEEALFMATERNLEARRPLRKGVLSSKEKESLPMIKLIIKSLIGQGSGGKLIFSIPGDPVDGNFDIFYHTEMMKAYLKEMGFDPFPMNEAFAIAFSELLDDNLTGMCLSFGAGMVNTAICFDGDPIIQFSITKGGDWIDTSVGHALDMGASLVQLEKEETKMDLLKPEGKIQEALAVYYGVLIDYALEQMVYELGRAKLPSFRGSLPVILSGGLTLAGNFVEKFKNQCLLKPFPFEVKEFRLAKDPMTCVAHGALLAATM